MTVHGRRKIIEAIFFAELFFLLFPFFGKARLSPSAERFSRSVDYQALISLYLRFLSPGILIFLFE